MQSLLHCVITQKGMRMQQRVEQMVHALRTEGFYVSDNALPAALTESVKQWKETLQLKRAGTGNGTHYQANSVQHDSIHWLEENTSNPIEQDIFKWIHELKTALNSHLFINASHAEAHIALYPPSNGYARHKDTFVHNNKRVMSVVAYFNDNWQPADGGRLRLYVNNTYVDVLPQAGRIVVFDPNIEHEVLPTLRERLNMACWLRHS